MKYSFVTVKGWIVLAAAISWIFAVSAPVSMAAVTCEVIPNDIPITLTYHGAKLTIAGKSAPDDDLIVKISSELHDTAMKNYEKVGGLVWMKKRNLEFKGVPGVYIVNSTADLNFILSQEDRDQHHLGYEAMAKATSIEDGKGGAADGKWFEEFIRFKENEKVYRIQQGTITRRHGEDKTFELVVDWPYQAPPGVYTVDLFAVHNGKVVDQATTFLEVQRVGVIAALSKMAVDQPALYGTMSVVVALAAGLAVGAVFKKGGGSH